MRTSPRTRARTSHPRTPHDGPRHRPSRPPGSTDRGDSVPTGVRRPRNGDPCARTGTSRRRVTGECGQWQRHRRRPGRTGPPGRTGRPGRPGRAAPPWNSWCTEWAARRPPRCWTTPGPCGSPATTSRPSSGAPRTPTPSPAPRTTGDGRCPRPTSGATSPPATAPAPCGCCSCPSWSSTSPTGCGPPPAAGSARSASTGCCCGSPASP